MRLSCKEHWDWILHEGSEQEDGLSESNQGDIN